MLATAVSYLTWKDIITLLTFIGSIGGFAFWLSRQFSVLKESLVRIEERERSTTANVERLETDLHAHAKRSEERYTELTHSLTNVRERVIGIESRQPPANGASPP